MKQVVTIMNGYFDVWMETGMIRAEWGYLNAN
jgi:hypothetical protein